MPVDSFVSARRFDFSRETFSLAKHRRSVVSLQGRVTVEADHNEQRLIDLHRNDVTARDVIGPAGVPSGNAGFQIGASGGDLTIGAGEMFVQGILCENQTQCSLLKQPDLPATKLADVPGFDATANIFAVELCVWERDVTPVDDSSIVEKALGGPDTSGRTETVWQVVLKAQSDPNVTCATAALDATPQSKGMLSAQVVPSAAARDCTLPPLAGYQGLENQLYRIEIHKGGAAGTATFKWSRENASVVTGIVEPIQIGNVGQTFNVQSVGADQTLGFADNQWVELTDDVTELTGDVGALALIQHVDPAKQEITLTAAPSKTINLMRHPKVRRWDQTDPTQTNGVPTGANAWIPLENGIEVRFETGATFEPGDYWIIPARTAIDETTGILDWPTDPQPAQHAVRYYAPLALVPFDGTNFGTPTDCRPKFDTLVGLTARKSACCCAVSVGDGKKSFGDFTKIADAINAVLATGGEICILAGTYAENVTLKNLKNIRIHGCHGETVLTGDGSTTPVISIQGSQGIEIGSLTIQTDTAVAVAMDSSVDAQNNKTQLKGILLDQLEIVVRDASAISCRNGEDIFIEESAIVVKQLAPALDGSDRGCSPAIFLQAERAEIRRNSIQCNTESRTKTALGGIQIGGGSKHVIIRENAIAGGNGNGITLGSVVFLTQQNAGNLGSNYSGAMASAQTAPGYASAVFIDSSGCVHIGGGLSGQLPKDPGGNPLVPVSEGPVEDVRILDNDIIGMGGSGISEFDPLPNMLGLELVIVLDIERNRIDACAQLDGPPASGDVMLMGRGGISLVSSEYVAIRDNVITRCGTDYTRSICGIWTCWSFGIVIERNQIADNGPLTSTQQALEPGPRGGIVLEAALPLVTLNPVAPIETGFPALRVNDNVVTSPSGPALAALAMGTVSVQNNQLTSHSCDQPSSQSKYLLDVIRSAFGGHAVFIWNLAWPLELASFASDYLKAAAHTTNSASLGSAPLISGDTTFNDNQVLLDGPLAQPQLISSATAILSLGDVSFEGNQCNASLARDTFLFFNTMLLAGSVRAADNRFQETFFHAALSALTWAVMNTTTANQGTHCFFAAGHPQLLVPNATVPDSNLSVVHSVNAGYCEGPKRILATLAEQAGMKIGGA